MLNPYEYGHLGDRIAVNDEIGRGNPPWLPNSRTAIKFENLFRFQN